MKLIYVVAAIAMLAMLMPAMAIPVSAAAPPVVATLPATYVGDTSATLNGVLTAVGGINTVSLSFQYGTTLGGPYTGSVSATPASNNSPLPVSFSATVRNLTLGTTYYFVAVATSVGPAIAYAGAEQSFTPGLLAVTSTGATAIGEATATLNGQLTALGDNAPVVVGFVYSDAPGGPMKIYKWSAVGSPSFANISTTLPMDFDSGVLALTKNVTYYYRAKAVDTLGGTTYGQEMSFSTGNLQMTLVDPISGIDSEIADWGYNVAHSTVQVNLVHAPTDGSTWNWTLDPATGVAAFVNPPVMNAPSVQVKGDVGEVNIICTVSGPSAATYWIDKKWAEIKKTDISDSQNVYISWSENYQKFSATATVNDYVTADFIAKPDHAVQGVILNWYIIPGDVPVPMTPGEAINLKATMMGLKAYSVPPYSDYPVNFATILPPPNAPILLGTYIQTVTGADGNSTVKLWATGQESVQIVVIPEYPQSPSPQAPVIPEITTVNFQKQNGEIVPQVRWAGEKIVLEAAFGNNYTFNANQDFGYLVRWSLQGNSPGSIQRFGDFPVGYFLNLPNDTDTVWTIVDATGTSSVISTSQVQGEQSVVATLYKYDATLNSYTEMDGNQKFFQTFFLELKSIVLGNVQGKRNGHDSGLWIIPVPGTTTILTNPWKTNVASPTYYNATYADHNGTQVDEVNVSTDALLRAQVRGYFVDHNGKTWILPDDWAALAGPLWKTTRPHMDIMSAPSSIVSSTNPLGDYKKGAVTVAANPVIGPFTPGIEQMTPTGWAVPNARLDSLRQYQTVVPDGAVDSWDAPMPPAKVYFQIKDTSHVYTYRDGSTAEIGNAGFFRTALKTDIYYKMSGSTVLYTNPFYVEMIPAHWAIPALIGTQSQGYDWNSFGTNGNPAQGPYPFWKIVDSGPGEMPSVGYSSSHPTLAVVYSDNHGEAMIYLNGDWNLNLQKWMNGNGWDVPQDMTVGATTVQAIADYPYNRAALTLPTVETGDNSQNPVQPNVSKLWIWGGEILGATNHRFDDGSTSNPAETMCVIAAGSPIPDSGTYPNELGKSLDHAIFIWATDRDGTQDGVLGAKVEWDVIPALVDAAKIKSSGPAQLSSYNEVTRNISFTTGFLTGTLAAPDLTKPAGGANADREMGISYMIDPMTNSGILTGVDPDAPSMAKYAGMTALQALFYKIFNPGYDPAIPLSGNGKDPKNYAVAAIDIYDSSSIVPGDQVVVNATITSSDFGPGLLDGDQSIDYTVNIDDTTTSYPLDDKLNLGDANADGVVNMLDVIKIENMILDKCNRSINADTNLDGFINMGDVIRTERAYLGY